MSQYSKGTPSTSKTAFNCPHCGAYTTQYWSCLYSREYSDNGKPDSPPEDMKAAIVEDNKISAEDKEELIKWIDKMCSGKPFIDLDSNSFSTRSRVHNLHISRCYHCSEMAIWLHEQLIYPSPKIDIKPNQDLPPHIIKLFDEAREIVNSSPRGAAALLRLSIQYLCKELGGSGKNINNDIAGLVSKGLNPTIQKALDVVRVIGNDSVHPGEISLDDDRDTAIKLFSLINLIADQMITHPKGVEEMYSNLPKSKLDAIEKRDKERKDNQ
jgi:hypothetical protein